VIDVPSLKNFFDCAVILSWPNSRAESHSNAYHYATCFAYQLPVVIVQPDLLKPEFYFENSKTRNLIILHVYQVAGTLQSQLINNALLSKYWIKPLFWVYNFNFDDFLSERYSPLIVYDATEDNPYRDPASITDNLSAKARRILALADLLIASSQKVLENYLNSGIYKGEYLLLEMRNGNSSLGEDKHLPSVYPNDHNAHIQTLTGKTPLKQRDDKVFNLLLHKIETSIKNVPSNSCPFNILVLYDNHSTFVSTTKEHLESFALHSRNHIYYAIASYYHLCTLNLSLFNVVILHYSIRLSHNQFLSSSYEEALKGYGGYKILFIQDEYENTETARKYINKLGIHAVFTCVPEASINLVYPKERFPHVTFIQNLTGYVPLRYEKPRDLKPINKREYVIGYRGRDLPYWYGNLGQEKINIGRQMRALCDERGIKTDIEWTNDKRIYGDDWYAFLENCRATLGTESGSNIFDEYGEIKQSIENELSRNPSFSYEEAFRKFLAPYEGKIKMNQASPKIFEAIALKTALILFEGTYSDIIQPWVHYIPLKKDFSNVDEVLKRLFDDSFLEELTNRAYHDIVQSGKYSYREFINNLDHFIAEQVKGRMVKQISTEIITGIVAIPSYFVNPNIQKLNALPVTPAITFAPLDDTHIVNDLQLIMLADNNNFPSSTLFNMLYVRIKQRVYHTISKFPVIYPVTKFLYKILKSTLGKLILSFFRKI
jgi:hypothetical protein